MLHGYDYSAMDGLGGSIPRGDRPGPHIHVILGPLRDYRDPLLILHAFPRQYLHSYRKYSASLLQSVRCTLRKTNFLRKLCKVQV